MTALLTAYAWPLAVFASVALVAVLVRRTAVMVIATKRQVTEARIEAIETELGALKGTGAAIALLNKNQQVLSRAVKGYLEAPLE